MSVLSLAGLVLLSGIVISVYALLVRNMAVRTSNEDSVKQAAMFVAQDLSRQNVEDHSLGAVGLADLNIGEGDHRKRVSSLNRLYATLRLDDMVGKQLQMPTVSRLVETDFALLKKLEARLRQKLLQRVDIVSANSEGSIFESTYKVAAGTRNREEELIDLRIKLGSLDSSEFDSNMPASGADPRESSFSTHGNYRAKVTIPVTSSGSTQFYQLANETQYVDASKFVEATPEETPSTVLVEAKFKTINRKTGSEIIQTRSAAALIGGADSTTVDSVLMVSFPQGMPNAFHSLAALISTASQHTGAWQIAAGGNVPGQGHLTAAFGLDSSEMTAQDALQTAFYHWLRSLGPKPELQGIERLFNYSWANLTVQTDDEQDPTKLASAPNSALIKDTGARAFAVFYQSGPGGPGQTVLKSAFEAGSSAQFLPNSAIPLDIDMYGNCNVAGREGFDRKLIADLLESVYETNLVANESMSVAKSIINRLDRAQDQAARNIELTSEELSSIANRRSRLETPGEPSAELKLLRKSEEELTAAINVQRAKRSEYKQVKERAEIVLMNAESAAQTSYDICANMAKYGQDGVFRCDDQPAFVLGTEYIFRPLNRSVTEDDIYKGNKQSSWLSDSNVLEPADDAVMAEGRTVSQRRAQHSNNRALPRFVILESRQMGSKDPRIIVLSKSPFSDSGIPSGQLGYYAQDALTTGQDPQVAWSLLVRDAVANAISGAAPIPVSQNKWCWNEDRGVSACPGLAVEVQVRSPVPVIPDLPVGSFVTNPRNHERTSQIPPMPANML